MIEVMEYNIIYNLDVFANIELIDNKSIDLVVTDPPYWHHKSPGKPYSQRNQSNTTSKFAQSDLYNAEGYLMKSMSDFTDEHIYRLLDILLPKMKIYNGYFFCSESQVPYYCLWADKHNLMFSILVWEKPISIINKNRFSQNLEYCVRVYDYGTALNKIDITEYYNRVFHDKPISDKIHPTQKPTTLFRRLIELSSNEGDVIFDPFMGSGTTAIACKDTNRNYVGFEINSDMYGKLSSRISNHATQLSLF